MAEPENTTVETPATETATEQTTPMSAFEKASKVAETEWNRVATEDATAENANAEQTAPTSEAADETKPDVAAKPEAITPEQLASTAFWGQLDKAGWERMERDYPVATAHVKAAQAAASRIVNEARKTAPQPAAEAANDKPQPKQTSAEMTEAIRRANSVDETEAAQGLKDITRLALKELLPEFGFNLEAAKSAALERTAFIAVSEAMPEIANLDPKLLDAAVDENPTLISMYERAKKLPDELRIAYTADVMRMAAESVITTQKASAASSAAATAAKTAQVKEAQRKVNSNASVVSNVVVDSPAGGAPKGKRTAQEIATSMWPTG